MWSRVTTAWLGARGAIVTGVDSTPNRLRAARALVEEAGIGASFVEADLNSAPQDLPVFDRLAGRYALHHLDLNAAIPFLVNHLRIGGTGAFVETMDSNPVLRVARKHLVGRFGVARCGTREEQPLTGSQLQMLKSAFGALDLRLGEMFFFRALDRQVFRYRKKVASYFLHRIDEWLLSMPRLHHLSYHQVVVLTKTKAS